MRNNENGLQLESLQKQVQNNSKVPTSISELTAVGLLRFKAIRVIETCQKKETKSFTEDKMSNRTTKFLKFFFSLIQVPRKIVGTGLLFHSSVTLY